MAQRVAFRAGALTELESRLVRAMSGHRPMSRPSSPGLGCPADRWPRCPRGSTPRSIVLADYYPGARRLPVGPVVGGRVERRQPGLGARLRPLHADRVELLGQQLTGLFVHASAGERREHSKPTPGSGANLYRVVQTR